MSLVDEADGEQMPVAHVDLAGLLGHQLHSSAIGFRSVNKSPSTPSPVGEASDTGSPPSLPLSAPAHGLVGKSLSYSDQASGSSSRRASGNSFQQSLAALSSAVSALHATSAAVAAEHSTQGKGGVLLTESDVSALLQAVQQLSIAAPSASKPRKQRRETSVSLGLSRVASSHSFGEEDSLLETFDAQPHIFDDATKDAVIGFLSPRVIRAQVHESPRRRRSTHISQKRVSLIQGPKNSSKTFASAVRMAMMETSSHAAVLAALQECPAESDFLQGLDQWDFDVLVRGKALQSLYDAAAEMDKAQGTNHADKRSGAGTLPAPVPEGQVAPAPTPALSGGQAPPPSPAAAQAPPHAPLQDREFTSLSLAQFIPAVEDDGFDDDVITLGQRALVVVSLGCMQRLGVFRALPVDVGRLASLLEAIASRYVAANSYHNAAHGADVAHATYYMLQEKGGGLAKRAHMRPETMFACILAAAAHDVGHVGFNNQFLVTTGHSLAIQYNDSSPLENMHAATLFSLMQSSGSNPMRRLARGSVSGIRRLMIHIIMSTDNAMHFVHVGELTDRLNQLPGQEVGSPLSQGEAPPSPTAQELQWSTLPPGEAGAAAPLQRSDSVSSVASEGASEYSPSDDEMLVLGMMVHACDISNTSRPWPLYSRWNERVLEEFHRQGDAELRMGLAVGPLNDRHANTPKCKVQAGFIRALVLPLFTAMQRVPELDMSAQVMPSLHTNLGRWEREIAQLAAGGGQAAISEEGEGSSDSS